MLISSYAYAVCGLCSAGGVSIGNVLPAADMAQFKQGVKSVAGKMAVLANGVMNSLQVRYGKIACVVAYPTKCSCSRIQG